MSVKLVVLDIAGTTVKDENHVGKAFQQAFQTNGYTISLSIINPLMGYEKKTAIEKILRAFESSEEVITTELIGKIHKDFVFNMIKYYQETPTLEFLPGVEKTIASLQKKGIKIAINTGFSRDIADAIVDRLKWKEKGLFDYLIASDEVELGRPYPFMIKKLMEQASVEKASQVAKVGDTEVDIREGQNAGCKYVIGVTTGAFTRAELEPYHPTHIIENIEELESIIEN